MTEVPITQLGTQYIVSTKMPTAAAAGRTVGVRSVPGSAFENGASRGPQLRVHSEEDMIIILSRESKTC